MAIRAKLLFALILLVFMLAINPLITYATSDCPIISRDEIINYAKTGVGSPYVWGGDKWDPSNRSWGGADCSGYVAKAWMVPKKVDYKTSLGHPYSTKEFFYGTDHWYEIGRDELIKGDALVRRDSTGGHVAIYEKGDPWGQITVYDARGKAYGIIHSTRYFGTNYRARRRHRLSDEKPQIISSRRLPNGSFVMGLPAGWSKNKMYIDNVDSQYDFFVTNSWNADDRKRIFLQNDDTQISTSSIVKPYMGRNFSQSIQKNPDAGLLRHSLSVITSSSNTLASAKASNGYIYEAVPQSFLYTKLNVNYFRLDKDRLYITNPTIGKVRVKISLYDKGMVIGKSERVLNASEVKVLNWRRNKRILKKSKNVYLDIKSSRSIIASRRISSSSYQRARPSTFISNKLFFEYFEPKKETLYFSNPSKSKANVSVTLFNGGRSLYRFNRTIKPKDVVSYNLSKTDAARYEYSAVKVVSKGANIFGSKRLANGHFVNAFQKALSSEVLYERFNPATEPIYVTNPGNNTINLIASFYNNGVPVYSKTYNVKGNDTIRLDYSTDTAINVYQELFVSLKANY